MSINKKVISLIFLITVVCFVSGCGTTRYAVPSNLQTRAQIPGLPDVRVFADAQSAIIQEDIIQSVNQEPAGAFEMRGNAKVYPVLAVSGGAANGAYGAGLLKGWTESGKRPNFKIVSGISTGALIAPIAFLGGDYDHILEDFYTSISTKDIMKSKGIFGMLFSDSFASNKPLAKILDEMVTMEMIEAVVAEYKKGKRLYIGTTNLDAQRLVLWDMGKIAIAQNKEAIELFKRVVLASAAIPGVFPPEFFEVEVDGRKYEEMHVDGSTVTQVFSVFGVLNGAKDEAKKRGIISYDIEVDLYAIRNGYIHPTWKQVEDNIPSISGRSLDTVINANGLGDVFRLYVLSKSRDVNFYYTYIPREGEVLAEEMFDPDEMKRLFDMGYEKAKAGYAWKTEPPFGDEVD